MPRKTEDPGEVILQVTPNMRRAVYEEDCQINGHIYNFSDLLGGRDVGEEEVQVVDLIGHDDKIPHIHCSRCNKVWLVVEVPGIDYDDAVAKLEKRLKPGDDLISGRKVRPPKIG